MPIIVTKYNTRTLNITRLHLKVIHPNITQVLRVSGIRIIINIINNKNVDTIRIIKLSISTGVEIVWNLRL